MDHDQLFKEVLRVCLADFLELFLPAVAQYVDLHSLEFLEQESFGEITGRRKSAVDVLVKARLRGQPAYFLIHVEAQASKRNWSAKRMFYYFAVQTYKHDLPVYPIALLSWDSPRAAEPGQYAVEFPDRRVLEFNFPVIQLNRLNWRDYLQHDNPAACALMAKMGVAPQDYPKVRAACLGMLIRLRLPPKQRQPLLRFIDAYLPLTPAQEQELDEELNRFEPKEKEVAMTYITSWERKGMAIGLLKGQLKGKLEGKLEVAVALLTQRLGPLSKATTKRLGRLTLERLEALLATLLEFESQADLQRWLRAHSSTQNTVNGQH